MSPWKPPPPRVSKVCIISERIATNTKIGSIGRSEITWAHAQASNQSQAPTYPEQKFLLLLRNNLVMIGKIRPFAEQPHSAGELLRNLLRRCRLPWPHPCCLHEEVSSNGFTDLSDIRNKVTLLDHPTVPALLTSNGPLVVNNKAYRYKTIFSLIFNILRAVNFYFIFFTKAQKNEWTPFNKPVSENEGKRVAIQNKKKKISP